MYLCDYTDEIRIVYDKLCRVVNAQAKKRGCQWKTLDVYREFESGETECRHLYYSMYGGYRVCFPGDVDVYGNICELDFFGECNKIKCFPYRPLLEREIELITRLYPDFKYVLKKWEAKTNNVFIALNFWKEHKEIEFMLATGFENVALNKSFWRYSEKKRREIVEFLKAADKRILKYTLADVLIMLNNHISFEEFNTYNSFYYKSKLSYPAFKYLQKKKMLDYNGVSLYCDYKSLLKQTTHKGDYWLYPKDLQKKHDELREEVARIKALEEAEKLKVKQEEYLNAIKKWLGSEQTIDGFTIYVPDDVLDIKFQAEYLHQCLISCDYISKVINKRCVLVFIRKGNKPIATAELLNGNKIGQFYANELDRSNCLPSPKVKAIMNKWLENKRVA